MFIGSGAPLISLYYAAPMRPSRSERTLQAIIVGL
jgi:hypothetical protein